MNSFSHNFITKFSFADNQQLLYGSVQPDIDECEYAFSHHFYNPVTSKDFRGSDDHAKNRCIWHLAEFRITGDWEQLGRSLHFLEDICTPVHTQYEDLFDAVFRLELHTSFEKKIDNFLDSYSFSFNKFNFDFSSVLDLIDHSALSSSVLYDQLKNNKRDTLDIVKDTVSLALASVNSLYNIISSNSLKAKKFGEINVIEHNDSILASSLDDSIVPKVDSDKNILVFKKNLSFKNFELVDKFRCS